MNKGTQHQFFQGLQTYLPEAILPQVVACLSQDDLIWNSLQSTAIWQSIQPTLSKQSQLPDWYPGALAIAAWNAHKGLEPGSEQALSVKALQADWNSPIEPAILQQSERLFQTLSQPQQSKQDEDLPFLVQAALLALAFRESRRQHGSWDVLSLKLKSYHYGLQNRSGKLLLASTLTCLFGLIPDPQNFLTVLLSSEAPVWQHDLALHCLLSNPLSNERRLELLLQSLPALTTPQQARLLQILSNAQRDLAAEIAGKIAGSSDPYKTDGPSVQRAELVASYAQQYSQAQLIRLAGKPSEKELGLARQAARSMESALAGQQALIAEDAGKLEEAEMAWRESIELGTGTTLETYYRARLARILIKTEREAEAWDLLNAQPDVSAPAAPQSFFSSAAALIAAELFSQVGDRKAARQQVEAAYRDFTNASQRDSLPIELGDFPLQLTSLLDLHGMAEPACRAAEWGLALKPNDPDLLVVLSKNQISIGEAPAAARNAYLLCLLSPRRADYHRLLANALEANEAWEAALQEHTDLVNGHYRDPETGDAVTAGVEEWLAIAHCALKAGQAGRSRDACDRALELSQDERTAAKVYLQMARANAADGEQAAALELFSKATQLGPGLAETWLALAEYQKEAGQRQKALETLRTATLSAAGSVDVYLALGEAYLQDWEGRGHPAPTQALATFQHAASLAPDHPEVALRLGQTLLQLVHNQEAHQVLSKAYAEKPQHPGLAYAYARSLLALQDLTTAIPVLSSVVASKPEDNQPYLDYARALLSVGGHVDEAIMALQAVLDADPEHEEAQALLAEALAAAGETEAAFLAFQAALETDLVKDTDWFVRLSSGLGKVALELNQIEVAVASFQEAAQKDSRNPFIQCTLAETYHQAGLAEEALNAARTALRLGIDNPDILTWFADQAFQWFRKDQSRIPGDSLGQLLNEAINALNRAVVIAPYRCDLLVRLGNIQLHMSDREAALATFRKICSADQASVADLHAAGKALLQLDDASSAVICLEKALKIAGLAGTGSSNSMSAVITDLSLMLVTAYRQADNLQAALMALEKVMAQVENDPELYQRLYQRLFQLKAGMLVEQGHTAEALFVLDEALHTNPDPETAAELHYRSALLMLTSGDLPNALAHVQMLLPIAKELPNYPFHLAGRVLAADLAWALLQKDRALALLGMPPVASIKQETSQLLKEQALEPAEETTGLEQLVLSYPGSLDLSAGMAAFHYYILKAEFALSNEDDIEATQAFAAAVEAQEKLSAYQNMPLVQARSLAVQARLLGRKGDTEAALQALQEALTAADPGLDQPEAPFSSAISRPATVACAIALTALELEQWDTSLYLLRKSVKISPYEPRFYLCLASGLVLKAEAQRLCQALGVITHAPGESSISEHAQDAFDQAINEAAQLLTKRGANEETLPQDIARWRTRGRAVFSPSQETAREFTTLEGYPQSPDETAAYIATLFYSDPESGQGEKPYQVTSALAVQAARAYPNHSLVLAQLALVLSKFSQQPEDAINTARLALRQSLFTGKSGQIVRRFHPVYGKALLAQLAYQTDESATAQAAIQEALAIWPDEPRWHATAANLSTQEGDLQTAIEHLKQALNLEPRNLSHYLALGQIFLKLAATDRSYADQAVEMFNKACELDPQSGEPWLWLAQAYMKINERGALDQAALCTEKAISLNGHHSKPYLLRAEIAMMAGDFEGAYQQLMTAQELDEKEGRNPAVRQPEGVLLLARILDGLDRSADALSALENALPHAAQPLPLLLERVVLLRKVSGEAESLAALEQLAKEYPDEPRILAELASIYAAAGDKEAAIRQAQRALQSCLHQNGPTQMASLDATDQAEIHLLLGRLLRSDGQLDQAVYNLNEALQLAPHLVETYLELGRTHQDRRQHTQALQIYERAIAIAPTDPRPYFHAGVALKESKDYIASESMLRRAAQLAPSDVTIHRQLGAVIALNLVHNRRRKTIEA